MSIRYFILICLIQYSVLELSFDDDNATNTTLSILQDYLSTTLEDSAIEEEPLSMEEELPLPVDDPIMSLNSSAVSNSTIEVIPLHFVRDFYNCTRKDGSMSIDLVQVYNATNGTSVLKTKTFPNLHNFEPHDIYDDYELSKFIDPSFRRSLFNKNLLGFFEAQYHFASKATHSEQKNLFKEYMDHDEGKAKITFASNETHYLCLLIFNDGDYVNNLIYSTVTTNMMNSFNPFRMDQRAIYFNHSTNMSVIQKYEFSKDIRCNLEMKVFYNQLTGTSLDNDLSILLSSDDCNFYVTIDNIELDNFQRVNSQVWFFSFITTLVCSFALYATFAELKKASQNDTYGMKISIISLAFNTILNSYFFIFHIVFLFKYSFFNQLAVPCICYFCLFGILQIHFLLQLWKSRNNNLFQESEQLIRAQLYKFNLKIYASVLTGLIIIDQIKLNDFLSLILLSSLWIPQIIHNVINSFRDAPSRQYIIAISVLHIAIPLYLRSYAFNFMELKPNYTFGLLLVLIMSLEVFILQCQRKKGSRFFVPKIFRPKTYNYYFKVPEISSEDLENGTLELLGDCAICLNPIEELRNDEGTEIERVVKNSKYMLTPCGHKYHINCLTQWMDMKLECPSCRAKLPPISED